MKNHPILTFSFFSAITVLLFPQICRADMIAGFLLDFPLLFFIVIVLGIVVIESWVIKRRLKEDGRRSLFVSLAINGITTLIGWLYYHFVSDHGIIESNFFEKYWIFILFITTFLIEAFLLRPFFKREKWGLLFQTSAIMNALSYLFVPLFLLSDAIVIGSIIVTPLIIVALLELFFEKQIQRMGKANVKKLTLSLLVILILFMSVGSVFEHTRSHNDHLSKARNAKIISDMYTMRTQIELVSSSDTENVGYSILTCNSNEELQGICKDIKENSGEYPMIRAGQDNYCIYAKLIVPKGKNLWFCMDRNGVTNSYVDPGSSGYCDGNTFICPPKTENTEN